MQTTRTSRLPPARHIDHHAFGESDLGVIELHPALAANDIVNLVGALVVMKFGVGDLEMMDFGRRPVLFFEQGPNLAASLGPGNNVRAVAPDEVESWVHGGL